jgi:hypothetical protein
MEYAAEDTFHAQNTRFGDGALSTGIYLPRLTPSVELRYEFSEWQDKWYVHHIYGDGLAASGSVLGHWGADWRDFGDNVGAQAHSLRIGMDRGGPSQLVLAYRTVQNRSYTGRNYRRAHLLEMDASRPWRQHLLRTGLAGGIDQHGKGFVRVTAAIAATGDATLAREVPADAASDLASESPSAAPSGVELFADMGVWQGKLRYERDVDFLPSIRSNESNVQIGIGIRKRATLRGDIGARVEFANVQSQLLTMFRAFDYRYRLGRRFALTAFAGAAVYDARTPAHGYYAGAGAQIRNVRQGWDLGIEMRYLDRLVRNKREPGEQVLVWPNEFWSMNGVAAYLSRRW